MNNKLVIPVLLAAILTILPIFLVLKYKQTSKSIYLMLCIISYVILMVSYLKIFTIRNISSYTLATQILYIHILQILLVTLAELVVFKNKISPTRMTGFTLGVFAIYFLVKNE